MVGGDKLKACTNSLNCTDPKGGFCNFDFSNWGFCEVCQGIIDCETEGFACERGESECTRACEGMINRYIVSLITALYHFTCYPYYITINKKFSLTGKNTHYSTSKLTIIYHS